MELAELARSVSGARADAMHPVTLAFSDPELERVFRLEHDRGSVGYLRTLWGLGVIVSLVGAGLLALLAPVVDPGWADRSTWAEFASRAVFELVVLTAPACATMTVVSRAAWFERNVQPAVAAVMACGYVAIVIPWVGTAPAVAAYAVAVLQLHNLGTLTMARLRFPVALAVSTAGLASFALFTGPVLLGLSAPVVVQQTFLLAFSSAIGVYAGARIESSARSSFRDARRIAALHHAAEALLHNVLPAPIADRLQAGEPVIADAFDEVTVLFADLVGFTEYASHVGPAEVVARLDHLSAYVDELAERAGVEKIKTIGDAYMLAAGVPERRGDHVAALAAVALELRDAMAGAGVRLRIGMHQDPWSPA